LKLDHKAVFANLAKIVAQWHSGMNGSLFYKQHKYAARTDGCAHWLRGAIFRRRNISAG